MIRTVKVTTTGSAGSATGQDDSPVLEACFLSAIKIDYHASAPATTDVTITEVGGLGRTLLTLTNNNTDGVYYPEPAAHDNTGTENGNQSIFQLEDGAQIRVAVAGADALEDCVTVDIQYMHNRQIF